MEFAKPILVTDNMREFFSQANLGPSNPAGPASLPLNQVLDVGRNGVTTRNILTHLFNIYALVNRMQQDPKNKQFLAATPRMYQYFQDTFNRLAARRAFNPKHFRYASIQSIIADNMILPDALTPKELHVLNSPEIMARLKEEQTLLGSITEFYRYIKSGSNLPYNQWAAKKREKRGFRTMVYR